METKFTIWYMRPDFFVNGIMGTAWLRDHRLMPSCEKLEETHIMLKELTLPGGEAQLEHVFETMQAENWSPNGEAYSLIEAKGLRHTSMSVGDIVVVGNHTHIVDRFGFEELDW